MQTQQRRNLRGSGWRHQEAHVLIERHWHLFCKTMGLRFPWPNCHSARMARPLRCWSWVVVMRIWPLPSYTGWVDGTSIWCRGIRGLLGGRPYRRRMKAVDDTGKGFMRCSSMMMMLSGLRLPPGAWDFSGCLKSFSATRRIHFGSLSSYTSGVWVVFAVASAFQNWLPNGQIEKVCAPSHPSFVPFEEIAFETGQGWPFPMSRMAMPWWIHAMSWCCGTSARAFVQWRCRRSQAWPKVPWCPSWKTTRRGRVGGLWGGSVDSIEGWRLLGFWKESGMKLGFLDSWIL